MDNIISVFHSIIVCDIYEEFEKIINSLNNINIIHPRSNHNILNLICSKNTKLNCDDKIKCIKLLIDRKININHHRNKSFAPLHQVLSKNTNLSNQYIIDAAKLLIAAGANVNAVENSANFTPLHQALSNNTNLSGQYVIDAAKLLIAAGANVNAVENSVNFTPLHQALSADTDLSGQYIIDSAKLLISAGANVNFVEKNNWTPLHYVLSKSTKLSGQYVIDAAKLLISAGANVNMVSNKGNKPIDLLNNNDTIPNSIKNEIRPLLIVSISNNVFKNNKFKRLAKLDNEQCSICSYDYKDMDDNNIHVYDCGHLNCTNCFNKLEEKKCPECRK